jgi:FtsZ-binding cell division protein ZapB
MKLFDRFNNFRKAHQDRDEEETIENVILELGAASFKVIFKSGKSIDYSFIEMVDFMLKLEKELENKMTLTQLAIYGAAIFFAFNTFFVYSNKAEEAEKKAIIDQITLIRQENNNIRQENNNIRQDYNNLIIERSDLKERLAILEERIKTK